MSTFESDVERPVTDRRRSLLRDPRWELAPVKDPALKARLEEILVAGLGDTELAWELAADGTWTRVPDPHDGRSVNAQRDLYQRALERAHRA